MRSFFDFTKINKIEILRFKFLWKEKTLKIYHKSGKIRQLATKPKLYFYMNCFSIRFLKT